MKIKMKTHRAGAKRYKLTGTGKLKRKQAGRSHLNAKKSSRQKRSLDHAVLVHPTNHDKIKLELPYLRYSR